MGDEFYEFGEEETRKVCPFRANGRALNIRCTGSGCAWWCDFAQECAVPLLAGMIADSDLCRTAFNGIRTPEAV